MVIFTAQRHHPQPRGVRLVEVGIQRLGELWRQRDRLEPINQSLTAGRHRGGKVDQTADQRRAMVEDRQPAHRRNAKPLTITHQQTRPLTFGKLIPRGDDFKGGAVEIQARVHRCVDAEHSPQPQHLVVQGAERAVAAKVIAQLPVGFQQLRGQAQRLPGWSLLCSGVRLVAARDRRDRSNLQHHIALVRDRQRQQYGGTVEPVAVHHRRLASGGLADRRRGVCRHFLLGRRRGRDRRADELHQAIPVAARAGPNHRPPQRDVLREVLQQRLKEGLGRDVLFGQPRQSS